MLWFGDGERPGMPAASLWTHVLYLDLLKNRSTRVESEERIKTLLCYVNAITV